MKWLIFGAFGALLAAANPGRAQMVRMNQASGVKPRASGGTITLTATPGVITFGLVGGGAVTGSMPVTLLAAFAGLSVGGPMSLYGYFATTNALTTVPGDVIPSSIVFGLCPTGSPTSYTAFTQSSPFAASSSLLVWQVNNILTLNANRTDTLTLKIDLTSKRQQPAGVYSGTLIFIVQSL